MRPGARIINLRTARKQRSRAAKQAAGDENAVREGRGKAQKTADRAAAEKLARHLDQHRRDPE